MTKKITDLTLISSPDAADVVPLVDVSASTTKKTTVAGLAAGMPPAGAQTSNVNTAQTTASTSYADLATAGPSVTVNIGSSGMALVFIAAQVGNNTNNQTSYASFVVSGASTVAASDANAVYLGLSGSANQVSRFGAAMLLTGLTPGSTTFKMQYRVDGGTGTFTNRRISVIPL